MNHPDIATLREISRRVLWLSTAIVDAANRCRPNDSGVKVGGHQASSASIVDIMVALWFDQLTSEDRVSVKPHAAPVLHAINYLLGDLDERYLPTLRAKGGLQLILHLGAKVREMAATGIDVADPAGLLKWLAQDRAAVTFTSLAEVHAKQPAFTALIRAWIVYV